MFVRLLVPSTLVPVFSCTEKSLNAREKMRGREGRVEKRGNLRRKDDEKWRKFSFRNRTTLVPSRFSNLTRLLREKSRNAELNDVEALRLKLGNKLVAFLSSLWLDAVVLFQMLTCQHFGNRYFGFYQILLFLKIIWKVNQVNFILQSFIQKRNKFERPGNYEITPSQISQQEHGVTSFDAKTMNTFE